MKIVGLVAFRDEEHHIPHFLRSLRPLVDEIVALDHLSMDGGPRLFRDAGATVLEADRFSTFGGRRRQLLHAGRSAGGTHFVVVDADEIFSSEFSVNGRAVIERLTPGHALAFPFHTLWRSTNRYRVGREYDLPLACVFADDGAASYADTFIHESRLPAPLTRPELVRSARHAALHLQFVGWERAQWKQAWYRAKELLAGSSATRINARYLATLDGPRVRTRLLPPEISEGLSGTLTPLRMLPPSWHADELLSWLEREGPERFEKLQIWHITALREAFVAAEGRKPRPQRIVPPTARFLGDVYGSSRAVVRRVTG